MGTDTGQSLWPRSAYSRAGFSGNVVSPLPELHVFRVTDPCPREGRSTLTHMEGIVQSVLKAIRKSHLPNPEPRSAEPEHASQQGCGCGGLEGWGVLRTAARSRLPCGAMGLRAASLEQCQRGWQFSPRSRGSAEGTCALAGRWRHAAPRVPRSRPSCTRAAQGRCHGGSAKSEVSCLHRLAELPRDPHIHSPGG